MYRSRMVLGVVGALLGTVGLAGGSRAAATDAPAPAVIIGSDLATYLERVNERAFAAGARGMTPAERVAASSGLRSLELSPNAVASLASEVERLAAEGSSMADDGRVVVSDISVRVVTERARKGSRVVTLQTDRTLGDGQVWTEWTDYLVVELARGVLKAGDVVSLNSDNVANGEVPAEAANLAPEAAFAVKAMDEWSVPIEEKFSQGSSEGVPATVDGPRLPKQTGGMSAPTLALGLSATNRGKIRDYALKHVYSYNTSYYKYSQDCTNFVSQAMRAGGWAFDYGWYRSNGNWWYTGGSPKATYSWAGAENWYRFARVESKRATVLTNIYDLRIGDILQYKASGSSAMTHSMITTGHSNGDPLLTYHTSDNRNKPFTSISSSGKTWFAHKV